MTLPRGALGPVLALSTGALWALSPVCFAAVGRRIGSFPTVVLRIALACAVFGMLIPIYAWFSASALARPDSTQVVWMAISGIFGMALGDILIYEALVRVGAARTTQLMLLAPFAAASVAWVWPGERLDDWALAGAVLIVGGTALALFSGRRAEPDSFRGTRIWSGLAFAAGGAVCTGFGAVTGRVAFRSGPPTDLLIMTAIRVWSSGAFLWTIALLSGKLRGVMAKLRGRRLLGLILLGTFAGPTAGMLCYVGALQHAPAGLVSTLVATSPLFVLPIMALRLKRPISAPVVLAIVIAITGIAMVTG